MVDELEPCGGCRADAEGFATSRRDHSTNCQVFAYIDKTFGEQPKADASFTAEDLKQFEELAKTDQEAARSLNVLKAHLKKETLFDGAHAKIKEAIALEKEGKPTGVQREEAVKMLEELSDLLEDESMSQRLDDEMAFDSREDDRG